jgi:Tol biopolymer transport system component
MTLAAGTRLGPYQVGVKIGAGGMGEVFRATDVNLGRDVAIKVLPSSFANDPDRLSRFAREARLLAALNHPNIATIHGLEEAGGVRALVMELVEGPTLAEKLAQGSRHPAKAGLPLADALNIAAQIAEALETAHDKGIVHRDLKPANLKIGDNGHVKVLDFGLAKALSNDASGSDLAHLPTITASDVQAGAIVGTPAYMSPEQARGQAVDKRTDIWAFGCVLFEMLAGKMAFSGETTSDTIAAILERQPDWSALPATTPPRVRHLLARCLEKDAKRRWRDIADVRIELEDAESTPTNGLPHGASRGRERAAWALLVLMTVAAAALVPAALRKPPEHAEVRFEVSFPGEVKSDFAHLALSPDGQQLLAVPALGGGGLMWLRRLSSMSGRWLPGTEGALLPFWSPDGGSIGFFADAKLKRLDVNSLAIEIVADAPVGRGGAWQADGNILFAPNATGPLFRVPATGGKPTAVTALQSGQNDHRAPFILPDGQHFLYYSRGQSQVRGVYVAHLDGSGSKRLLDADAAAVYTASGHLLFARQGELLAQPFDAKRLTLNGEAFHVADRISVNPGISLASLSASASGPIAFGTGAIRRTQFAWFDRSGTRLETVGAPDQSGLANPTLSPDGRQIAFSRLVGGSWDIWQMDMQGAMNRITSNLLLDFNPVWGADNRQIFFQSNASTIASRSVLDGAPEQIVFRRPEMLYPSDVSPDGRVLLYTRASTGPTDLWYISLVGDRAPRPFVATEFRERDGQFSPDGKWIAYQSNESGRDEIYLRPFPGPGDRIQVSAGGGQQARWGVRSGELFYVAADQRLTSVPVTSAANGTVALGTAHPLFRTEIDNSVQTRQQYMVSADGQRFLINALTDASDPPSNTVILNWKGKP